MYAQRIPRIFSPAQINSAYAVGLRHPLHYHDVGRDDWVWQMEHVARQHGYRYKDYGGQLAYCRRGDAMDIREEWTHTNLCGDPVFCVVSPLPLPDPRVGFTRQGTWLAMKKVENEAVWCTGVVYPRAHHSPRALPCSALFAGNQRRWWHVYSITLRSNDFCSPPVSSWPFAPPAHVRMSIEPVIFQLCRRVHMSVTVDRWRDFSSSLIDCNDKFTADAYIQVQTAIQAWTRADWFAIEQQPQCAVSCDGCGMGIVGDATSDTGSVRVYPLVSWSLSRAGNEWLANQKPPVLTFSRMFQGTSHQRRGATEQWLDRLLFMLLPCLVPFRQPIHPFMDTKSDLYDRNERVVDATIPVRLTVPRPNANNMIGPYSNVIQCRICETMRYCSSYCRWRHWHLVHRDQCQVQQLVRRQFQPVLYCRKRASTTADCLERPVSSPEWSDTVYEHLCIWPLVALITEYSGPDLWQKRTPFTAVAYPSTNTLEWIVPDLFIAQVQLSSDRLEFTAMLNPTVLYPMSLTIAGVWVCQDLGNTTQLTALSDRNVTMSAHSSCAKTCGVLSSSFQSQVGVSIAHAWRDANRVIDFDISRSWVYNRARTWTTFKNRTPEAVFSDWLLAWFHALSLPFPTCGVQQQSPPPRAGLFSINSIWLDLKKEDDWSAAAQQLVHENAQVDLPAFSELLKKVIAAHQRAADDPSLLIYVPSTDGVDSCCTLPIWLVSRSHIANCLWSLSSVLARL